jgi:hypothetical protein
MFDASVTVPLRGGAVLARGRWTEEMLRLTVTGRGEDLALSATIRVQPPVRLTLALGAECGKDEEGSPGHWELAAPSVGNAGFHDVFTRAARYFEDAAWPHRVDARWRDFGLRLAQVRELIRRAARAALAACDPMALQVARCFHRSARWYVYAAVVQDRTGRIAQLAAVCPGVLLLASALADVGEGDLAERILDASVRGRPLREVIGVAVRCWEEVCERDERREAWLRTFPSAGHVASIHPILLQRAGAQVDPLHLLAELPDSFAPEDIPARADRNADWFQAMAAAQRTLSRGPLATELGPFVSRHARAIRREARRHQEAHPDYDPSGDVNEWPPIAQLAEFCTATGRRPSRRSNPRRIFAEVGRWAREADASSPEVKLGALLARVRETGLGEVVSVQDLSGETRWGRVDAFALPRWPHASVSVPGIRVEPIESAAALAREGQEMGHCVAWTLPDLMTGAYHVFSVRAGGARLTLAIRRTPGGRYELDQLRGQENRSPGEAEYAAVGRWIEAVNARAGRE